jgi:hypothetical protein
MRMNSRAWLAPFTFAPIVALASVDCYSTGDGTAPPTKDFYYPVGLQVSPGGTVLYAVNSDFDLQYNGGTLQSYDLSLIRRDTLRLIADPRAPGIPILDREQLADNPCPARSPSLGPLGETCAPPVRSSDYVRRTAIIGAFATDLQLSRPPSRLVQPSPRAAGEEPICPGPALDGPAAGCPAFGSRRFDRLFVPVRGNASITWATVERDGPDSVAPLKADADYGPFNINCGQDSNGRCNGAHSAGSDPDEQGNTRHVTMPGEPFGMAISQDGESIIVTHQNETKTSLFSTGLRRDQNEGDFIPPPAIKFILDGVPFGGVGAASIPHDRDAFFASPTFPRQAFLETSRARAEVTLLRQYPDEFAGVYPPPPDKQVKGSREFLDREASFPITIGAGGTDSRGIVIDPTPRIACKAKVRPLDATKGQPDVDRRDRELKACGRKPARVFIANRSPAALLVGEIGGSANALDDYDPDRLVIHTTVPLSAGPSKVYLAPVVEKDGRYALRVFAVCFDSATVFVYDPDAQQLENVIRVGLGPFAMAFDPFNIEDVATNAVVAYDPREAQTGLRRYRFAYLASFTNSFVQVIDLDNAQPNPATYERIVFTLGRPTNPKGS